MLRGQPNAQELTEFYSWVDFGFACPWYPSFEAALAANPFPLPFNGVDWPEQDCIFAPAP